MAKSPFITALSLFVVGTVLLSSVHAKQVLGSDDASNDGARSKKTEDSSKIVHDLHHHSDKSGSQLIKDVNDSSKYVDSRSLRLARHKKETVKDRLHHWKQAFEEIALTHHMFI